MPTYEYVCKSCGKELEEFQSMSAKPLRKCPKCGKNTLERKIGVGAGIIFKGGGFYETDYRSESYKKSAESEKKAGEPAKESKSADAGKSDAAASKSVPESKPAESSPTKARAEKQGKAKGK